MGLYKEDESVCPYSNEMNLSKNLSPFKIIVHSFNKKTIRDCELREWQLKP